MAERDQARRSGCPARAATLSLTWGASCRPAADYVVQEGTLTALRAGTYDDVPLTCSTGGLTSHTAAVPLANAYFLVHTARRRQGGIARVDRRGHGAPARCLGMRAALDRSARLSVT
jgi:hypothetical protein